MARKQIQADFVKKGSLRNLEMLCLELETLEIVQEKILSHIYTYTK